MAKKILDSKKWWEEKDSLIRNWLKEENIYPIKIEKIVLNSGVGKAINDKQLLDNVIKSIREISYQKPLITKARKSITSFKLREGMEIGCKVTIRGKKIKDFFFKLLNVYFPSIRDFRGFSQKSFDKFGNYNIGIKDLSIFPEVDYSLLSKNQGIQVTFVFSNRDTNKNKKFLTFLDFPFHD